MKEYKPQLRVSADDLCSATTLGNTVIGILFEKRGSDIKKALSMRLSIIDEKIDQYNGVVKKIVDFIDKKRKVLKDFDIFYQGKCDEREALIAPYKREIEAVWKKCDNVVYDFNRKIFKDLSKKAVVFEDGFEQFKPNFDELDEFLQREENIVSAIQGYGVAGLQGQTGIQGLTGSTGCNGMTGSEDPMRGIGYGDKVDAITKDEDSAVAKMETLRSLLQKYLNRVESLKQCVKRLKHERRSLSLILKNIADDRVYKLDLNKLSAFGFEDLD